MSAKSESIAYWKNRHMTALASLGMVGAYRTLKAIENQAHYEAELYCNGAIDSEERNRRYAKIVERVKRVFGGTLPAGFFLNGDPRGYALKIDPEKGTIPEGMHTDRGGYGILAPDFN